MLQWTGDGITAAKHDLEALVAAEGGIPFMDRTRRRILPTADRYKHTGCWSRGDAKPSSDVKAKMATIRNAGTKLRKHILANKSITTQNRVSAAHTHVFPTGEYGTGTWTSLTVAEKGNYHRTVTDIYRVVDGSSRMSPEAARVTDTAIRPDVEVIKRLGVMRPLHRIIVARFRLFLQLLAHGDVALMTILVVGLKAPRSWLACVIADLTLLSAVVPKWSDMRFASPDAWVTFLKAYPKQSIQAVQSAPQSTMIYTWRLPLSMRPLRNWSRQMPCNGLKRVGLVLSSC